VTTELLLSDNQITTMAGVRFPPDLEALELQDNKITSLKGVQFPSGLTSLSLNHNQIDSLQGVRFPHGLTDLYLGQNKITSLNGVQFPPGLIDLDLSQNKITSLAGVQFPATIKESLHLGNNQITSLKGVQFPSVLESLVLNNNQITSLSGVQFPSVLLELDLRDNAITSLYQLQMPPDSTIDLKGNPLLYLHGIINPDEYLMDYLKHHFPSGYFREFHYQRKDAKMAQLSALKAARQSQKADLKFISDSTQQSMRNQLNAVTSFLRDGMEARVRQHEEQLAKEVEERGRAIFYIHGPSGKKYTVPLNTSITIQEVIDYLNDHYYISVLGNCGVMRLVFSGKQLEPERTLADYNVLAGNTLHIVCAASNPPHGGSKKRPNKRPIKSNKAKIRRNKSMKK
jgi:Leucine-rich repeat (LRR) protein